MVINGPSPKKIFFPAKTLRERLRNRTSFLLIQYRGGYAEHLINPENWKKTWINDILVIFEPIYGKNDKSREIFRLRSAISSLLARLGQCLTCFLLFFYPYQIACRECLGVPDWRRSVRSKNLVILQNNVFYRNLAKKWLPWRRSFWRFIIISHYII